MKDGLEFELTAFDPHLKRRTLRSIIWTMCQTAGDQVFSFAVFVLLARLLDKPSIGTFAIAFVFMDMGRNLATAGVSQRIARTKELNHRDLSTIFWTNLAIAASYAVLIIILAPFAERAFGAPQLAAVLVWLMIPVLLSGAGNTHMALRLREFGHKTLALRSVLGGLIGGSIAVVAALMGFGIWALVLQRIIRELVCTILAWTAFPWKPGLSFDFPEARRYFKNGIDLGFAQVVTLLSLRSQDLGVARVMGPAAVSSYRVAWRCAELIGPQVVGPFATVALQTFSRLQNELEALKHAYTQMLQQCALISIPALIGYSIAGPWLVPALFGPQWQDAGAVAPMLLPLAIPFTINQFVLALLAAKGRISWQRHLSLIDLVSTIIVTILTVRYGLRVLALTYGIRSLLLLPVQIYLVRRVSGIGFRDHLKAIAGPLFGGSVMGLIATMLFRLENPTSFIMIALLCGFSAVVYLLVISAILPQYPKALRRFVTQ